MEDCGRGRPGSERTDRRPGPAPRRRSAVLDSGPVSLDGALRLRASVSPSVKGGDTRALTGLLWGSRGDPVRLRWSSTSGSQAPGWTFRDLLVSRHLPPRTGDSAWVPLSNCPLESGPGAPGPTAPCVRASLGLCRTFRRSVSFPRLPTELTPNLACRPISDGEPQPLCAWAPGGAQTHNCWDPESWLRSGGLTGAERSEGPASSGVPVPARILPGAHFGVRMRSCHSPLGPPEALCPAKAPTDLGPEALPTPQLPAQTVSGCCPLLNPACVPQTPWTCPVLPSVCTAPAGPGAWPLARNTAAQGVESSSRRQPRKPTETHSHNCPEEARPLPAVVQSWTPPEGSQKMAKQSHQRNLTQ